ncbi:MAG: hypothetical protein L6Q78_14955 [Bacteroidia bacterium]|nr:hypothetical protein [Bacteroidia bacterium]
MKLKTLLAFAFLLFGACSKDSSLPDGSEAVVSNSSSVSFEQLVLLLNVKTNDSAYLVVESLDSVNLYVNNAWWNKVSSLLVDTTRVDKISNGNRFLSNNKINYLVLAKQGIRVPALKTAGDFSTYLNSWYTIKPGDYACFIESFSVRFNDGSSKTYFPYKYIPFTIIPESASAFVGEIELQLQP